MDQKNSIAENSKSNETKAEESTTDTNEKKADAKSRRYGRYAERLGLQHHYLQWGITAFLVLAAAMLFYYLIFNTKNITRGISRSLQILRPIIYGLILAYLMAPIVNGIENRILVPLWKKMDKEIDTQKSRKTRRNISIVATVFLLILLLYLFFANIIPQLMQSLQNLVIQFPIYTKNLQNFINNVLRKNPQLSTTVNALLSNYNSEVANIISSKIVPMLQETITRVSSNLVSSFVSVLTTLWNLVIGLIVSIYLLASKEHFTAQAKKLVYSVFRRERANQIISDAQFVKHTFADYISGKLIDSLIIGLLCFIGTTCLVMPYSLLVSVIVGLTNIIPFFGPYLGAIPSALIIFMVDPQKTIVFIVFILILQQFDGNFLGPKILGDSTGLSSFWIIFSITVMGGYFGILGMAIGVPIFAIFYAAIRSAMNKSLKKKNLSVNTGDYRSLQEIDEEHQYQYIQKNDNEQKSDKYKIEFFKKKDKKEKK